MKIKDKLPLIIGIAIPIFLIIFVGITSYIPSLFVKPQYDFIYSHNNYDTYFAVENGKLNQESKVATNSANPSYRNYQPVVYYYSQQRGSRVITLEEAQTYTLDPSSKSSDGFTVGKSDDENYGVFPFYFGSRDYYGIYLQGKGLSKKIDSNYYDFKFLGWVIK